MKTKLFFLTCFITFGVGLSSYQINAQNVERDVHGKYIQGMHESNIMHFDSNAIHFQSPFDTIYSFPTPGDYPGGLTWDGQYFWNSDHTEAMIFKLNANGEILTSFPVPENAPSGGDLAWDGNHLWLTDEQSAHLFKIDTATGSVLDQFQLPSFGLEDPNGWGLAWDGEYLWHSEYILPAMIYKIDPQDGQVVSSFAPPRNGILGICWADSLLYGIGINATFTGGTLIVFDPTSGAVLDSALWEVPYPLGLSDDGQYFWNTSGSLARIYQVSNPITSIDYGAENTSESFTLVQNYPNPFTTTTAISYTLLKASDVELSIYNSLGQKVKSLVKTRQEAGEFQIRWDGTNDEGRQVPGGIYTYCLQANTIIKTHKMILHR